MHGITWFDDSDKSLDQKIEDATIEYEKKYGQVRNTCLVHPTEYDPIVKIPSIKIIPSRLTLPGYIWLGYYSQEDLENLNTEEIPQPVKTGFFKLSTEERELVLNLKGLLNRVQPYLRLSLVVVFIVFLATCCFTAIASIPLFMSIK